MQNDDDNQQQSPPRHFLLIDNPSKTTHLGTLLRCAAAFRAHQVLIVGHDKFNAQGSFGSHLYLDIVAFPSWKSVMEYLERGANEDEGNQCENTETASAKSASHQAQHTSNSSQETRIPVVGIMGAYGGDEVVYSADGVAVYEDTQTGFATLSSRDKRGLPTSHALMCNSFVHVPQICFDASDSDSDAQLNTQDSIPRIMQSTLLEVATVYSIILHHFTAWANYNERSFAENQKFIKDTKSDMRRRLCRRYGDNRCREKPYRSTKDQNDLDDVLQEEDGLVLEQAGGVFASDY